MKKNTSSPRSPARPHTHALRKPRLTAAGWALLLLWLGVPAMLVGAFLDFLLQWLSGECVGVWCLLR